MNTGSISVFIKTGPRKGKRRLATFFLIKINNTACSILVLVVVDKQITL